MLMLSGAQWSASAAERPAGFYIGGGDGSYISNAIQAAIAKQGTEAVGTGLDSLVARAREGKDVSFPGLEGDKPAEVAANRAWVMTAALNVQHCQEAGCELVDRMQLRITVTPYQFRNRVEYWMTYPLQAEPGKNIDTYARAVVREFYNYEAGSWDAPAVTNLDEVKSSIFDSSNGWDHWRLGTSLIYGLQLKADSVAGFLEDNPRTSTAQCYPSPDDYCAW